MSDAKAMSLKAKIRNLAKTKNIPAQVVLQNYMFERFLIKGISPIREDDIYGGYRVALDAIYETIITPMSIDISTGDVITPDAVKIDFVGIFDDNTSFELWAYNIETVLAEKVETILRRSIFNTRPRDFYDVYILLTTQEVDFDMFREALKCTIEHRGTREQIGSIDKAFDVISDSSDLSNMWSNYQRQFSYAKDISFEMILKELRNIL